ncbi:MAG: hypothetical protein OXI01_05695 [Albidovulum sp.]|nr:hypothetical protein [Albidovulum sp.]
MRSPLALLAAAAIIACSARAQPVAPQEFDLGSFGVLPQRIGVVDLNLLFLRSHFGSRALRERSEAGIAIQANNDTITEMLIKAENDIAEQKTRLTNAGFEVLRSEFDAVVECIRVDRKEKSRLWKEWFERQREGFIEFALNNIQWILPGVDIVLPKSSVVAYRSDLDVTGLAVEFINDTLEADPELVQFDSVFRYVGISEQNELLANYQITCGGPEIVSGGLAAGRNSDSVDQAEFE